MASRLAAGPARTADANRERAGYRSVRVSPEQVRMAAERRMEAAKSGSKVSSPMPAPVIRGTQQYVTALFADGTIHEFVDAKGDQTSARTHVHVIHDERYDEVRLHVSLGDGRGRHSEKIALVSASGREVNAAVDLLTEVLRARGR